MVEISDERYEELRQILEKQNGKTYTFEEAKEVGDGLIDFYALLTQFDDDKEAEDDNAQSGPSSIRACIQNMQRQ